jgi:hypothetical protein
MPDKKMSDLVGDVFSSLRSKLVDPDTTQMIDKVDNILSKLSGSILDKNDLNYSELVKQVFSSSLGDNYFNNLPPDILYSYDIIDRIVRYANAQEICDLIPYCARALKVLTDEIVSADDITKQILQITTEKSVSEKDEDALKNVRNINDTLNIDSMLYDVVYDTLGLGDQFLEVCDYTSSDVPITQSILNESGSSLNEEEKNRFFGGPTEVIYKDEVLNESGIKENVESKMMVETIIVEADPKDKDKEKTVDLQNVRIIMHDPRFVIKLQSWRFRMNLGYLVLPRPSSNPAPLFPYAMGGGPGAGNLGRSFSYASTTRSPFSFYQFGFNPANWTGIDKIYNDILASVKRYIGTKEKDDLTLDKKEVMAMITRVIRELEQEGQSLSLKIRYVPPERMTHFMSGTKRFFPYGEGIFFKITFAAKLLIAFETALVMKRLTDATDKRLIYVETGLPRNVRSLIEEIKETFRKRKFALDSAGSIGAVPSMVTTFEDIYIPQNKGKRYVEFDTLGSNLNIRDISDELKLYRDFLVSNLEVPPAYLNLEENLSNKNALSFENILFARTIIAYQKRLSKHIRELFQKVYKFVYSSPMPQTVNVNFMPPKMLQIERDAENIDIVSRIIATLKDLGIPLEYLKKKYLPLDWEEIKKFETKEKIEADLRPPEDMGGMGGGFGGLGGVQPPPGGTY